LRRGKALLLYRFISPTNQKVPSQAGSGTSEKPDQHRAKSRACLYEPRNLQCDTHGDRIPRDELQNAENIGQSTRVNSRVR
jgi:hypothetical protein